jgi:release factor glutamine methyltransferase
MSGATVEALLAEAGLALRAVATARLDAEVLLQSVLGTDRAWLYAHPEQAVAPGPASDFQRLVATRSSGFPVAYLTGVREFWSLPLAVSGRTLIPRPETELLVETGLRLIEGAATPRVLDLGTGCGAIAVAVAKERADAAVVAADVCAEALAVARANAAAHAAGNVQFRLSDWYDGLRAERFDLILCNPPYVDSADPALVNGEIRFEPRLALDGGPGGMRALLAVIAGAARRLDAGGCLAIEHGCDQGDAVIALLRQAGFCDVATLRDAAGLDRVSHGIWR